MNNGIIDEPDDSEDDEPLAIQSRADGQSLRTSVEREFDLAGLVCKCYRDDTVLAKVLANPKAHPWFGI